jgi:hypothetical protein
MEVALFALFVVVGPNGRVDEAERISDKIIAAVTSVLPHIYSHAGNGHHSETFSGFMSAEDVAKSC